MIEEHSNFIPYPNGIFGKFFRLPLLLHRIGLGWLLRPFHFMVLTVVGRTSGKHRHVVLEYRRHGSKLYVISGWGERPQWYRNLLANPEVTVQFGVQERAAHARVVTEPAESMRALYMFQRSSPVYEAVMANMSSADTLNLRTMKKVYDEFTIVRFDLLQQAPKLAGVQPTHRWVSWTVASLFGLLLVRSIWTRSKQHDIDTDGQTD